MEHRRLTQQKIEAFFRHLIEEEKSAATVEKYLRDVRAFSVFVSKRAAACAGGQSAENARDAEKERQTVERVDSSRAKPCAARAHLAEHCNAEDAAITKELAVAYKKSLVERGYAAGSVNSMLASLNSFFRFCGWEDCRVRNLRTQKKLYCPEEKELQRVEYLRLLNAAQSRPQLYFILQTICGTGIRVSELQYFTVESVRRGEVTVSCKNKTRVVFIPGKLRRLLLRFARRQGIASGVLFRTKSGKPVNRSNIWAAMKQLCEAAGVVASKVFPHSLRKLFARTFYAVEKDIAKLADILGHSSINTTRIYIMSTGNEHRRKIERLQLVV